MYLCMRVYLHVCLNFYVHLLILVASFSHVFKAMGVVAYYILICDLSNSLVFGHTNLWLPLTLDRGSCDLKDALIYGHNKL